ncbi:MAG: hypothetical protein OXD50_10235 [Chloroflexi bacterium]|nr:hypothetical protein [Chloroflexota bacterium]
MSTPNGNHPHEPNGATSQATSTVLALDGWGPVVAEPPSNGANGSEPEVIVEEAIPVAPVSQPGNDWRQTFRSGSKNQVARPSINARMVRVLVPAVTMTLAIVVALRLGDTWRQAQVPAPEPAPPSRITMLRRRIALTIDPTLEPIEPQRNRLLSWLN